MPTVIIDPPQLVYLLLGGLLIVTAALAAQRQDRRAVIPFAIAFLLMLLVFLIDKASESPREEAVRRAHMLAMAADAKNPDAFAEHLADKVTIAAGNDPGRTVTRDELRRSGFWAMLRQTNAHIAVWDFSRDDVKVIDDSTIEIGFLAKGEGQGQQVPLYVRATFGKQADGSFKLTTLRTFDAIDRKTAFAIPMLP